MRVVSQACLGVTGGRQGEKRLRDRVGTTAAGAGRKCCLVVGSWPYLGWPYITTSCPIRSLHSCHNGIKSQAACNLFCYSDI